MTDKYYRLNMGVTKSYLLSCTDGYLLVDTGYNSNYKNFCRQLARLDISISQIKHILITHHHDDHAGFAAQLRADSGAKLIVHKQALEALQAGRNLALMQPVNTRVKLLSALLSLLRRNVKYPPVQTRPDDIIIRLDDKKTLPAIGIEGKILCTPGHCSDSISIVMDSGIAFVGDLATNFPKIAGLQHRPLFVENMTQVLDSWQKVLAYGAWLICPAHGNPIPANQLKQAEKKLRKKL